MNRRNIAVASAVLLTALSLAASADEAMVDMADGTDFSAFHEQGAQNEGLLGLGGERETAVDPTPIDVSPQSSAGGLTSQPVLPGRGDENAATRHIPGELYIIRARYTLDPARPEQYDLFEALLMLNRQMNQLCPLGWEKEREWMEPVAEDYYLHFRFRCLDVKR